MALGATLHHIEIALSDSDRGVYESLDLRVARHPSESMKYLVTRVLGYCLLYEEGLAFSRGLSVTEEPAIWICEPGGRVRLWVDIGRPSAERLHKASKAAGRVVVCTTEPAAALRQAVEGEKIHRAAGIEVVSIEKGLVDALETKTGRSAKWEVVHSGGGLYVTAGGDSMQGAVEREPLAIEA